MRNLKWNSCPIYSQTVQRQNSNSYLSKTSKLRIWSETILLYVKWVRISLMEYKILNNITKFSFLHRNGKLLTYLIHQCYRKPCTLYAKHTLNSYSNINHQGFCIKFRTYSTYVSEYTLNKHIFPEYSLITVILLNL